MFSKRTQTQQNHVHIVRDLRVDPVRYAYGFVVLGFIVVMLHIIYRVMCVQVQVKQALIIYDINIF